MAGYKTVVCDGTISSVTDAIAELTALGDEAREVVDNASEGLAQTQRIQTFDETASALEGISEPDVPECVQELAIRYSEQRKKKGESRAVRCGNAVSVLSAAVDVLENWLDGLQPDPEDDEGQEQKAEVEQFKDDLQEIIDAADGCEFPGMYG
jgi:uncharacterized protein (UPF0147 family)